MQDNNQNTRNQIRLWPGFLLIIVILIVMSLVPSCAGTKQKGNGTVQYQMYGQVWEDGMPKRTDIVTLKEQKEKLLKLTMDGKRTKEEKEVPKPEDRVAYVEVKDSVTGLFLADIVQTKDGKLHIRNYLPESGTLSKDKKPIALWWEIVDKEVKTQWETLIEENLKETPFTEPAETQRDSGL